MDALDAIDRRAIYFIEGAGQQGFVTAWGDGFVTDGALIAQHNLSDPRPFFDVLLEKAYVKRASFLKPCPSRSGHWQVNGGLFILVPVQLTLLA